MWNLPIRSLGAVALTAVALAACKPKEQISDTIPTQVIDLEPIEVSAVPKRPNYKPAETRVVDLQHMKLEVKFDWQKQHLMGRAEITLKPYFHPVSTVTLDAKGFDIHEVALMLDSANRDLPYDYDSLLLDIKLDRAYTREETLKLYINYTAKPEELKEGGGQAITSDKGLYFINPLGEDAEKPKQIWTQGEPESNSAWFPTVDSPNERISQELFITVDEKYKTLSNGKLVFQSLNGDGTRTDYWKQELPHAPYLCMMAIGEFDVIEDAWDELPVHYYVEPEYSPYAQEIFGNTPEILKFYSERLGVMYPWDKYHQVVVRDYVSGAMENTSAVIHGDFLHQTSREMLDGDHEDVIAHEAFHHWFGDLVTCESWANLPLNEAFATYGEYLWKEYKYGREAADAHIKQDLQNYLQESRTKRENMIRFDHGNPDDMFDSHSYAKGGRVLHMLRYVLGDEAFFAGLKNYLDTYRNQSVEIHQLRLAMEEVSGQDLNWFFDQWFLDKGHPILEVNYEWDDSNKLVMLNVEQTQKLDHSPLYRLPVTVDIYSGSGKERHDIVIDEVEETFALPASQRPKLVNFDGEKVLLAVIKEKKDLSEWVTQYYLGQLFLDRDNAITHCAGKADEDSLSAKVILDAMDDDFYLLRRRAINNASKAMPYFKGEIRNKLLRLAYRDRESVVRAAAVNELAYSFSDDRTMLGRFRQALNDDSYLVISKGLDGMAKIDPLAAMKAAEEFEDEESATVLNAIAEIYAKNGGEDQADFFPKAAENISGFQQIGFMNQYSTFLKNDELPDAAVNDGLDVFENVGRGGGFWFIRLMGIESIRKVRNNYTDQQQELTKKLNQLQLQEEVTVEMAQTQPELNRIQGQIDRIDQRLAGIKKDETNPRILKMLD